MRETLADRAAGPLRLVIVLVVTAAWTVGCASESTTAPSPSVPLPSRRSVETHPIGLKWNWAQLSALRPFLRTEGGGSTFYEVVWCDVERDRGKLDWSDVDAVASRERALGSPLLIKIRVGRCWASGHGTTDSERKQPSSMPTDLAAYRHFVTAVVERYEPHGVTEYAVENEPNALTSWQGSSDDYRRLVEPAAGAIHHAAPDATVLDGGLSSIGYGVDIAAELLHDGRSADAVAAYNAYYARRFEEPSFVFPQISDVTGLRDVLGDAPAKRASEFLDVALELAA